MTPSDILNQAYDTFNLIHENEEIEEFTEDHLTELWNLAVYNYQLASEDYQLSFGLKELEEEFNEPRGCPT